MLRACFVLLVVAPLTFAQLPREELPPLSPIPPVVPDELGGGQAVSRPLQPVKEPAVTPTSDTPTPLPDLPPTGAYDPQFRHWASIDYLMAWTPSTSLPQLATANMFGQPVLGDPNTVTLLGGTRRSRGEFEGMRFVLGSWGSGNPLFGSELAYHFLGTKTDRSVVSGGGVGGEALLGRPLFNPRTGREDVVPISHRLMLGELAVSQSLRVQGWELGWLRQLYTNEVVRVSGLAGYRYFMMNEGLRLEQLSQFAGVSQFGLNTTYRSAAADQIDAHNRFHGGTLGLRTQFTYGGLFAQVDTKVSLGRTTEVVRISGQTVATADSAAGHAVNYFAGGVLGQPTNSGRTARGVFAVLPEANVRLGYQFSDRSRVFVGYQFTYLSDAVRAGEQLDRVVDLSQTSGDPLALLPPAIRPRVPFARSDFWVQGVTLGVEWRY